MPPQIQGQVLSPDPFAPSLSPPYQPPQLSRTYFASPSYTGAGRPGTPLFYSSAQYQGTVAADLGSTLQVTEIAGLPKLYPFKLLLEWGTPQQEIALITSSPAGDGPYQFTGVMRGQDGGGPQVTHAPGTPVAHGVSAADFAQVMPVFNVCAYGADPNGIRDITAAFQAACDACVAAGGGIVQFPAGNFSQHGTVTVKDSNVALYIQGAGWWATTIYYAGAGDCLRIYNTSQTWFFNGGGVRALAIDGANATGASGSTGLHVGDLFQYEVDIAVQNFTTPGSFGVHFDNQYAWTEQLHGRIYAANCVTGVAFDHGTNSACSGSYDRIDMTIYINQVNAAFDGVSLLNGSYWVDGAVAIRGNFGTSATPLTSAVLRIAGTAPAGTFDAGVYSNIAACRLDIGVETGGGLGNAPYTIFFGTPVSGNFLRNCYGVMDFINTWHASNNSNSITYSGPVAGDATIITGLVQSFLSAGVFYISNLATLQSSAGGNLQVFSQDANTYNCGQILVQATSATTGTTSGTASQNVTGLVTPALKAGAAYYLEITVPWTPSGTIGSHVNWGFAAGGGLTLTAVSMTSLIMASGTTAEAGTSAYVTSTTLSNAMWTGPTVAATAGAGLARFWGTVTVGVAGTLQVVFANATAADTITVTAGATMIIRPMS